MAARKASTKTTDHALEQLKAWTSESYLQDEQVRRALAEQGIVFDDDEQQNQQSSQQGDETTQPGTQVEREADDEQLEALAASTADLETTHRDRLAADRVRRSEPAEGSDRAMRQALADDAQRARGLAQRQALETQQNIRARFNAWADRLGTAPTPGGVGMLLLILMALLLILIDVNGKPRLWWLWDVLLGNARLMAENKAAKEQSSGATSGAGSASTPTGAVSGAAVISNGNSASANADTGALFGLPSLAGSDFERYLRS